MPEDRQVSVEQKPNHAKTFLLYSAVALSLILLWYVFVYKESIVLENHVILIISGIAILGVILYFRQKNSQLLPSKDKVALEIANWYYGAGYGFLDYYDCEMEIIGKEKAYVYFPSVEKTYLFIAGRGVMGERRKDIEESIIDKENSETLTQIQRQQEREDNIIEKLEKKGLLVTK